jgi:hypothetical protein
MQLVSFLVGPRTYQHPCNGDDKRATQAVTVTDIKSNEEYFRTEFYKTQASASKNAEYKVGQIQSKTQL